MGGGGGAAYELSYSRKYSRFNFFAHGQEIGQSFRDYITELRKLSSDCELEGLQKSLLRDMLIVGLNDKKLQ